MNIMSTGQTHVADEIVRFPLNTLFDSIDQQMRSLDMDAIIAAAELPVNQDRIARLIVIHDAVRPLLRAMAVLPLIPERWHSALKMLIGVLDEIASSKPTFMARKV